jgi:hypothetical protein
MNKKLGVSATETETPLQTSTETPTHHRHDGCDCQAGVGSAIKTEQSTLPLFFVVTSSIPLKCANEASRGGPAGKSRFTETRTSAKGHYRPVATSFKHAGFNYRQIARENDIAIYEQRWIRPNGELSENVAYEVVRIRRREAEKFLDGFSAPAREVYPSSEQWGDYGWTLTDRDPAFNKFRQIVAGRTGKTNLEQDGDVLEQEQTETQTETQ